MGMLIYVRLNRRSLTFLQGVMLNAGKSYPFDIRKGYAKKQNKRADRKKVGGKH